MKIDPWYITGLIEGEGCFCVSISKHQTKKLGYEARLMFEVEMIIDDKPLLEDLQKYFGCGNIYILNYERYKWRPHVKYAVKSQKEIFATIIPFFKKYPLKGKKKKDFELFCEAAEMFKTKEHLTEEGLKKLRKLQLKMNIRRKLE